MIAISGTAFADRPQPEHRGDHVAIETVYSGHIHGAPTPFAVPATTILELRAGLIASDRDYDNLATLLAQSGLPATWTPPTS